MVIISKVALFKTEPSDTPSEASAPRRSLVSIAEFPSMEIADIVGRSST